MRNYATVIKIRTRIKYNWLATSLVVFLIHKIIIKILIYIQFWFKYKKVKKIMIIKQLKKILAFFKTIIKSKQKISCKYQHTTIYCLKPPTD